MKYSVKINLYDVSNVKGEKITDFTAELQQLTQNCNSTCPHCKKSIADLYLRTQFIRGVRDTDVLDKAFVVIIKGLLLSLEEEEFE